ncbi:polymeric immunoglobulin receptor-like [Poecilia formosa]|uniref:polymeric immunoglobulin receptor-like n=1 Tax=Poecilia formosa TaxID=48698 RepID=UPI0004444888|nr:PREDICTED: polymeric immunoglobulin receptor-like [Poecilia formosa]XP_016517433.1 PREDICTED: polymeric immunoglobulin receptor-like [Poecilia formosa]
MIAQLTLLCFLSLCLQGAGSCYREGAMYQFRAAGENFSFLCLYHLPETWKIFCRDDCEGENVLIKTQADSAQSGRFSSEYQHQQELVVSISPLTKSDSGTYHCGTGASVSAASFTQFQLRVTDAVLHKSSGPQQKLVSAEVGGSVSVACSFALSGGMKYFCRGDCGGNALVQTAGESAHSGRYSIQYERKSSAEGVLLVTITELSQSDSGRYRCQQDGPRTAFIDFDIAVTPAVQPSTSRPETTQASSHQPAQIQSGVTKPQVPLSHYVPVIVGVTLAAMVVLVSAALLVSCRRRSLRGLRTRGGLDASVTETLTYENCFPEDPEDPEEPAYQSLHPSTQDQNQIYSELTQPK